MVDPDAKWPGYLFWGAVVVVCAAPVVAVAAVWLVVGYLIGRG
jgi:hypothetical protein